MLLEVRNIRLLYYLITTVLEYELTKLIIFISLDPPCLFSENLMNWIFLRSLHTVSKSNKRRISNYGIIHTKQVQVSKSCEEPAIAGLDWTWFWDFITWRGPDTRGPRAGQHFWNFGSIFVLWFKRQNARLLNPYFSLFIEEVPT